MEAVICHDFGDSRVEEISRPSPEKHEVLLEIKRVQLSVTDCKVYQGEEIAHFDLIRSRMESGGVQAFGHEFSGVVVEVGESVTTFDEGDRVYAPGKITCGDCAYCRKGLSDYCSNKQTLGGHLPGALAEYIVSPSEPLTRLPDEVTNTEGAAMQPLASAMNHVREADVQMGDKIVVIGAGVMGNQCAQIALHQGASEVTVVDIDSEKCKIATEFGMKAIDSSQNDPVQRITDLTNGIGADIVFEAVGGDQTEAHEGSGPLAQAFKMLRPGGKIMQVGIINGDMNVTPQKMKSKYARWIYAGKSTRIGPNAEIGRLTAELVASGQLSIKELITHECQGLGSFEQVVDMTLNKNKYNAIGPTQIVVNT